MTIEEKAAAYAEKAFEKILTEETPWNEVRDTYAQTYLAGATEAIASQWVSVEERMPEDMKNVLVHCSDADPEISDCIAYLKDGVWCFMDEFYYDCTVSHWLPIPGLPAKGGEK